MPPKLPVLSSRSYWTALFGVLSAGRGSSLPSLHGLPSLHSLPGLHNSRRGRFATPSSLLSDWIIETVKTEQTGKTRQTQKDAYLHHRRELPPWTAMPS